MFVYRSWPDLIRHRGIVYYVYGMCVCTEVSKTIDMYAFLFNDILLLTKIKKPPRKVRLFGCFFDIYSFIDKMRQSSDNWSYWLQ